MLRLPFLSTVVIALFTFSSCKDDPAAEAVSPSNLNVSITMDEETEGLVHVEATADQTNFYRTIFSEGSESTYVDSKDGKASYQYTTSGTHDVITSAHALEDLYIDQTDQVVIQLDDTSSNGGDFPSTGYSTPESYNGYTLVWQDEFDGDALNTSNWSFETGTGTSGWGNNELQYYREENTSVGNGVLTIEARNESFGGSNYTSSRITTQGKQEFKYGRIDIRAALPYGQGLWPALWMLGDNFSTIGWPECGEIDIMELTGGGDGDKTVFGTIHWDDDGTKADYGETTSLSSGTFADEFHVFSIIWDDQSITWYVDDKQYLVVDITPANLEEFHNEFFFIFNVAVGGNLPGSPDASTVFPQRMYVDYVRVFQEQ